MLAAWLAGNVDVVDLLDDGALPAVGDVTLARAKPSDALMDFHGMDEAAKSLATRKVLTAKEYAKLDATSKLQAFTVSKLTSEATIEKIQRALADDVASGGTLAEFRERVQQAAGKSPLAAAHVENIYRTNVAQAYAVGQRRALAIPAVTSAFPYVAWWSVADARRRHDHAAMETAGLDGTNVYRADDPEILRTWAPHAWNCRCRMVVLSIAAAARRGVREAQRWLATGMPPATPQFVGRVPILTPPGW